MSNLKFTLMWSSYLAIHMFISSYLSYKLNITKNNIYFISISILGFLPIWPLIAKYSKNLFLDAFLFDILVVLFYSLFIGYFTNSLTTMNWYQYLGFSLTILGLVLIKV